MGSDVGFGIFLSFATLAGHRVCQRLKTSASVGRVNCYVELQIYAWLDQVGSQMQVCGRLSSARSRTASRRLAAHANRSIPCRRPQICRILYFRESMNVRGREGLQLQATDAQIPRLACHIDMAHESCMYAGSGVSSKSCG